MESKTNILLIHGVGDLPNEDTRLKSQKLIQSDLTDEESIRFYWYDWNKSIQNLQSEDDPLGVQTIANATKLSARLEFPQVKKNSTHFRTQWFEIIVSKIQLLVMILFLFHFVLFFFSWIATYLPTEPPPLTLRVEIDSLLFPPLDPVLIDEIYPIIRDSLLFSALAALVIVPILQIFIAASLRDLSLRVAIRSAVLDLLRPLIGVITSPTTVTALLIFIAGGFALLYGFFSRPVAITDLQGNYITYGGDRILGVLGLPLAIFLGGLVIAISTWLFRKPLKVISDIVRYLGHSEYRNTIHQGLTDMLSEIEDGSLIIVAHSLGTVIAVDSLLAHFDFWARFGSIRLLTCGSPIRRLFHRFFPVSYPAVENLNRLFEARYEQFSWTNAFRPLDYIGCRLSRKKEIVEHPLPQKCKLHIGYWTDRSFTRLVAKLANVEDDNTVSSISTIKEIPLTLNRFQYAPLENKVLLRNLLISLFIAGCLAIVIMQFTVVPAIEKEHHMYWLQKLKIEVENVKGSICPQREVDTSEEFSGFERAVAGIEYQTRDGRDWVLEAYANSRPDINWDEVQKAAFGRIPPSPLVAGLRGIIGLRDTLLNVQDCQEIEIQYANSDPRIFRLPDKFHRIPVVGVFTKIGRIFLLILMWVLWFGVFAFTMNTVLGMSKTNS